MMNPPSSKVSCRAVVLTALPIEFNAVREHLVEVSEETHPAGSIYEKGYFRPTELSEWEVILAEIGAGNAGAAAESERVINHYQPNVILFVGVAGGVKDVAIGDVVAGSKVYGYESGKESGGFRTRPNVHEGNYALVQRARTEARNGRWRERIRGAKSDTPPRALVGPIAAGEKLVADKKSSTAQLISRAYGDTLAVEMEGYGFLQGAHLNQNVQALVIRGISDLLDGKENADRSGSQERASANASAFCFEVLAKLSICPGDSAVGNKPEALSLVTRNSFEQINASHESRFRIIEKAIGINTISDAALSPTANADFVAQMNSARDLLKRGQGHAAKVLLEQLQLAAKHEEFDNDFKYRLETNLGASALLLDRYEEAEQHFERALVIKREDPKGLANRAQIAIILRQPDIALKYASMAWSINQNDSSIAAIYLWALDVSGRADEARQIGKTNAWMQSDSQCAMLLGVFEFDDSKYAEAEALARASLDADPENAQAMELIGRCILVPLQKELDENQPLPDKLPSAILERAKEAESFFSAAIAILEHQDYKQLLMTVLGNRGAVRSVLARTQEALQDYDRALSINSKHSLVKTNKARVLLTIGRPHEALELLESVDAEAQTSSWHPLAVAYLATKQPKKALQLLSTQSILAADELTRIRMAELFLEAYSKLSDFKSASKIVSEIQAEFPNNPEAIALVAEWTATQQNGFEDALRLFYRALEVASDNGQKDRITLSLADLYYKNDRFSESADLYGKLLPSLDQLGLFNRYLKSLFFGGSRREALKVAVDKRAGGSAIPFVSAIEAHLLQEKGDLAGAEKLLEELIELEPDNPDYQIELAYLRYRRADYDGSKKAVLGVGVEEINGNAHQLLALAKVYAWLELDGAIDLAYRARRLDFKNAEVHRVYVSLFLHRKREKDSRLDIKKIGAGTTVHLTDKGGRTHIYTIVAGLDADLQAGELMSSDPVALKLLGHVSGDTVVLREGELEQVAFRVEKIESQYVHAFQETISNFSQWFPHLTNGLETVTVDQDGVNRMLEMVGNRHTYVESVIDLYSKKQITIGMLANLIGRSVIEVWSALQNFGDLRIFASRGNQLTSSNEAKVLSSSNEVVFDLLSILTFAALGLLPALKSRFKILLATQFVFDEIRDELLLERAGIRNTGSFYIRDGRYVLESPPLIVTQERKDFLESISEFLRKEVSLQSTNGVLDLPRGESHPLGQSAVSSILLANERGAVLCSDDEILRTIAQKSFGVASVWSQNIISELHTSGCISASDYHRAIMDLVQRNYSFVHVTAEDYLWLLETEEKRLTQRFLNSLSVLRGPDCSEDSAIGVAGQLLRSVYEDPSLRKTRQLFLDACISALKHQRQPTVVLSKLDAHVQRVMVMNPQGLAELRQVIKLWIDEPKLLEARTAFGSSVRMDGARKAGGGA